NPPSSLINAVAASYTNNGSGVVGDIKAMLRTLFNTTDPMTVPFKYKRPYHLMCSTLRSAGATINTVSNLRAGSQYGLTAMGQMPFYWSPPDGYPDTLDVWVGLIQPRWNFGFKLANCNAAGTDSNGITGIGFSAD